MFFSSMCSPLESPNPSVTPEKKNILLSFCFLFATPWKMMRKNIEVAILNGNWSHAAEEEIRNVIIFVMFMWNFGGGGGYVTIELPLLSKSSAVSAEHRHNRISFHSEYLTTRNCSQEGTKMFRTEKFGRRLYWTNAYPKNKIWPSTLPSLKGKVISPIVPTCQLWYSWWFRAAPVNQLSNVQNPDVTFHNADWFIVRDPYILAYYGLL